MEPEKKKPVGRLNIASHVSQDPHEDGLPSYVKDALGKLDGVKMRIPLTNPSAALAAHYIDVLKSHMKEHVRLIHGLEEVQKELKAMESWGQYFSAQFKLALDKLVSLANSACAQLTALISGIPVEAGDGKLNDGQIVKLTEHLHQMKMKIYQDNQKLDEELQAAEHQLEAANVGYRCKKLLKDVDEPELDRLLGSLSLEVDALSAELTELYKEVPPTKSWSELALGAVGGLYSQLPAWYTSKQQSQQSAEAKLLEMKKEKYIQNAILAQDLKDKIAAAKEALRIKKEGAVKGWFW